MVLAQCYYHMQKKEPLPLSHIYKNELKMGHGSNIRTKSRKCLEEI